MAKDYKTLTSQPKVEKKYECEDSEHVGDRKLNRGDWWMCWPDFVLRCQTCYERHERLKNRKRESRGEESSQEELLFDAEES